TAGGSVRTRRGIGLERPCARGTTNECVGKYARPHPRSTPPARGGAGGHRAGKQAAHGKLAVVENALEAIAIAVIRVGYLGHAAALSETHEHRQPMLQGLRTLPTHEREVTAVHRQNQVEALEVPCIELPRPQSGQVVAT